MQLVRVVRFLVTRYLLGWICFCASLSFHLYADLITFENGDRISGELVEETRTEYVFRTEYGTLRVPIDKVVFTKEKMENAHPAEGFPEDGHAEQSSLEMLVNAKMQVRDWFPDNWKGRFSTSLEFMNSRNDRFGFQQKLATYRKIDNQRYDLSAYYAYSKVSEPDGDSIKTRDEHGADIRHTWDFHDRWYSSVELSYLKDEQRDIKFQVQPSSAIGYRIWDETDLTLSIQTGPTWRFIDASQLDANQVNLINFGQRFMYRLNGHLKFLQSIDYFRSIESKEVYNTIFRATIVSNLTDLLDTRLSYVYDHNSIVGREKERRQGRLTLSLGVPF